MNVELLYWYSHPEADSYYNHKTVTGINSLGTFNDNLRVPDLLLTALYRLDPKTGRLVHDVQLKLTYSSSFNPTAPAIANSISLTAPWLRLTTRPEKTRMNLT